MIRPAGALVAVALHVLAGLALASYAPARPVLPAGAPVMVDLIVPPRAEPKPEPIEIPPAPPPPKPKARAKPAPKPVVKAKPEPPPLAVPMETPAPEVVSTPSPPVPEPVAEPELQPEPAPEQPVAMSATVPEPAPEPQAVTVTPPVFNADYLDNPPPAYPAHSRRIGEQGRVVLRVLVNASGAPQEVQISASSGHARLDQAARAAVQRWRFVPAKRGEEPVAAWVLIPVSFGLDG